MDKTWTAFKQYFSLAHQELRESQLGTTNTLYGSVNAAINQDTVEAIANLVTATAHDRATVSTLTTTNTSLTMALIKANSDLVDALKMITFLTKKVGERGRTSGPTPHHSRPTNIHYCYMCRCKSSHSSLKCTTPGPGHQTAATKVDTMGGPQKISSSDTVMDIILVVCNYQTMHLY